MEQAGLKAPATSTKTFVIMGKTFDPAKPKEYLDSFAIKRT
jgi:nitrate/nitrite transport system substrate-binding protein